MLPHGHDVAQTRLDNALALFDEFVRATVSHPDAAALRGLERRFAEKVLIQPSYWSQIKSRSRQIGERLARQFEQCCHKPRGWMDEPHLPGGPSRPASTGAAGTAAAVSRGGASTGALPQDDEERFVVGLVLEYYRRDPRRAKARLLELLGDALLGGAAASPGAGAPRPASSASTAAGGADDDLALWRRSQQQVAPLKPKR
jgi:hypothetical protein